MQMSKGKLVWKKQPEGHDYEAARAYLSLNYSVARTRSLVQALRAAPVTERSAKDLLRASGLPLLASSESSVSEDLKRIGKRKPLSPVLVIAGDMTRGIPLVVADGYHRICAVCYYNYEAPVAVKLV